MVIYGLIPLRKASVRIKNKSRAKCPSIKLTDSKLEKLKAAKRAVIKVTK